MPDRSHVLVGRKGSGAGERDLIQNGTLGLSYLLAATIFKQQRQQQHEALARGAILTQVGVCWRLLLPV